MQGINIARTLIEGLDSTQQTASVFFFDGIIPDSVEDLTFDPRNIADLINNSVGHTYLTEKTSTPSTQSFAETPVDLTDFTGIGTTSFIAPIQHIYSDSIHSSVTGQEAVAYPNLYNLMSNKYRKTLGAISEYWRVGRGNVSAYFRVPELVNANGDPVDIVGFAFNQRATYWKQGSLFGYVRATGVALDRYDSVNDVWEQGAGNSTDFDKVVVEDAGLAEGLGSTVGGAEFRARVTAGANYPRTSSAVHSGDPSWSLASLVPLVSEPAFISPTDPDFKQITWALVLPQDASSVSVTDYHSYFDYQGTDDKELPVILCDVGLAATGAGIEVEATDTSMFVSPKVLKLNLEFKD